MNAERTDWLVPSLYLYRRDRALSLRELAARAGVSQNTIFRLEHGAIAHPSTVRKLAAALGCEPADLLAEPEDDA
jgi:transcriptional regulator with XRE-family HTH domain